jgi:hypothetical protein
MTSTNPNNLGNLAYYDSFSGLIPCKVTGYDGFSTVYFTVTADRKTYKRGEKLTGIPSHVVPRKMIRVRSGKYIVRPWYTWVNGNNGVYAIQTTR